MGWIEPKERASWGIGLNYQYASFIQATVEREWAFGTSAKTVTGTGIKIVYVPISAMSVFFIG
jgi:hypothetical protein